MKPFANRTEAGRFLGQHLMQYANRDGVITLALPRGGVPIGFEVAHILHCPLDLFIVRKLGYPGHEEFAIGAIASGGLRVINATAMASGRVTRAMLDAAAERETREIARREQMYRGNKPFPDLDGKIVILVDDGLATGSTMRAGIQALRQHSPARIVAAAPVASAETCQMLQGEADEVVCPATPDPFYAVGQWYRDFTQTSDDEVQQLLARAAHEQEVLHAH